MGILARKRRKKRHLRYAEALKAMKAYQNNQLKLEHVVDRKLTPGRSKGDGRCALSSCRQWIRWEYHMRSKVTNELLVVGSTCVWTLLELSKEKIKSFEKIERTIKDFHRMLEWRKDNLDVWQKIREAQKRRIMTLEAFWEEIKYEALDQEDTDYIRNLDLDAEEKKWLKKKDDAEKAKQVAVQNELPPDGYDKVIAALDRLVAKFPDNDFYKSLKEYSGRKILTPKQITSVKLNTNRLYYDDVIKNDPNLLNAYENCDAVVRDAFIKAAEEKKVKIYSGDLSLMKTDLGVEALVKKYRRQFHKLAGNDRDWKLYRVKKDILLA